MEDHTLLLIREVVLDCSMHCAEPVL